MGAAAERLDRARSAYRRHDWVTARDEYTAAAHELSLGNEAQTRQADAADPSDEGLSPTNDLTLESNDLTPEGDGLTLSGDDLYALANCHWWLGSVDTALPALHAAYRAHADTGNDRAAAMVALDTGYTYGLRGEEAQATGWMSRAVRHLRDAGDCAEQGYLAYIDFEQVFFGGDLAAALACAAEILDCGQRFGDPTLVALGVLGEGRVLVKRGEVEAGMALLDEAMVAAVSDDLDPGWAGNIYCNLMLACYELADWRRANEWTTATATWCESMPGSGPFMGICRVHRAQVLSVRGEWDAAESEVRRVCDQPSQFHPTMAGEAWYQLGELHRQRGAFDQAEAAFGTARDLDRDPCPGLALLHLHQGRTATASELISHAMTVVADDALARARLLPAAAEIAVASERTDDAAAIAAELDAIARTFPSRGMQANAATARGRVALARGNPVEAIAALQEASEAWQDIGSPYEAAITRLLLADAHTASGMSDAAARARDAADTAIARLGIDVPTPSPTGRAVPRADGLTPREAEVLRLVADGRTNQQIATELVLSIRTVERHLATVYQKLGLHGRNARAAAVRYAMQDPSLTDR